MVRRCAHRIRGLTEASADSARHSSRLKDRFALTHRLCFWGRKPGLYQHSTTAQRSVFEHVSICSPSQFARLHENHINYWRAVLPPSTACGRFFFRAGARSMGTDLLFGFLSTVEHRLAADRSNQISLYARSHMKRHLRC